MRGTPPGSGWWREAVGVTRPALKAFGRTLRDVIGELDQIRELGFDVVEVFAPSEGGTAYWGLDALDFSRIDPAIGSSADFDELVDAAHSRGIRVVPFLNLGYVHERHPAFLRACDAIASGIALPEIDWFLWSETGRESFPPSSPELLEGQIGHWHWSDRAGCFYWVRWDGDEGDRPLPQLNWAGSGWRAEAGRIVDIWLGRGVDGIIVDATNWYVGADWRSLREAISGRGGDSVMFHPEGAGGFGDDPVVWIRQGGFDVVMDYGLRTWWDDIDAVRDAVDSGDPDPLESALAVFRDRVDAAGGVCYIDPPVIERWLPEEQELAATLIATLGELYFDSRGISRMSPVERRITRKVLELRRAHPALRAAGARVRVATDRAGVYAFTRGSGEQSVLVVVNLTATEATASWVLPSLDGGETRPMARTITGHGILVEPLDPR